MPSDERYAVFERARERIRQRGTADSQQQSEAIRRRFAAMGNLNSGAAIKAESQAAEAAQARALEANEGVDAAEQTERARQQDVTEARAYQTQEREASQGFATKEREASQGFSTKEREASQLFNKQLFDEDMTFKKTVFADEAKYRDLNYQLAREELDESKWSNDLNAIIAIGNADLGDDIWRYRDQLSTLKNMYAGNRPTTASSGGGSPRGARTIQRGEDALFDSRYRRF